MHRYLCIDGVEVSNPNRTIAYLRHLGAGMLANPGQFALGDCGCDAFEPDGFCAVTVRVGVDLSSPEQWCMGLQLLTGDPTDYFIAIRTQFVANVPTPMPPPPAYDGDGWSVALVAMLEGQPGQCAPYTPPPPPGEAIAMFQAITLVNTRDGSIIDLMAYFDGNVPEYGSPSPTSFSFDQGATWFTDTRTHTFENLPCASTPDYFETRVLAQADETILCIGPVAISGLTNPVRAVVEFAPAPAPLDVGDCPPPGDPAWTQLQDEEIPSAFGVGCFEWDGTQYVGLPPDGFYRTTFSDENGNERVLTGAINWSLITPGDLAGSQGSYDDGATWLTFELGYKSITVGEPPPAIGWTTPAGDDAPWYDPTRPESADVLGVWIDTWDLSNPLSRKKDDRTWGSSLGAAKMVGRELVISGVIFATTCKASDYAKQWLYEALSGGCDGGPCGLPEGTVYTACPDGTGDTTVIRSLKRLGLISYDPQEPDDDFPCCWGIRFEATLATETPYLYHEPELLVTGPLYFPEGEGGSDPACNICTPCPQLPAVSPLVCGCANVPVKVVPEPDPDDCWCNPAQIYRRSFNMNAPALWTQATLIIRITAGFETNDPSDPGIRNLRLRAWPNPMNFPGPTAGGTETFNCLDPCLEIDVACVPRGATLTIDGTTRTATVSNNGGSVNGFPYLSSGAGQERFTWPEISCHGLMVTIDSDAFDGHTAPDSTIEIEMVGLDRG